MVKLAIIGGDGIGPEVTREATRLLEWYRDAVGLALELWPLDLGAERYLQDGTTLPVALLEQIRRECAAVFVGALGDPRVPGFEHARDILLGMRFGFDLYANVRPVRALADQLVPLKRRRAEHVRLVVFRENTEGVYAGVGGQIRRGTPDEIAISEDINTRRGVERILRAAFEHARGTERRRLHMADKSNAMRHAHELWLRTFQELCPEYPEVEARHVYIDSLCLQLVQTPEAFDVIVTNNLFGDIVTDLAAALQGGLGMAPSANLHPAAPGHIALFEPVHGSAPELAGKDLANPMAALLTVGMLLSHLGWPEEERRIEAAVADAVAAGDATPDVGGTLGTSATGAAVLRRLEERRGS